MISPAYARTMASYNALMNERIFEAASRLPDAERRQDRGAFWRSIHETLSHLIWADRVWMHRLAGSAKPAEPLAQSGALYDDFSVMADARKACDARISDWAGALDASGLDGILSWFSGAAGRDITIPRALVIVHLFNHQTHHRGQIHAMLTATGQRVGDTDLPLILPAISL